MSTCSDFPVLVERHVPFSTVANAVLSLTTYLEHGTTWDRTWDSLGQENAPSVMVADENCNMQFLHITQYKYNMYFNGLYLNGRLIGISKFCEHHMCNNILFM